MPTLRLEPQHPSHAALRASQLQVQDAEPFQGKVRPLRSEEHTSELQSRLHLVCRLLLEKKKQSPGGWNTFYSITQRPSSRLSSLSFHKWRGQLHSAILTWSQAHSLLRVVFSSLPCVYGR